MRTADDRSPRARSSWIDPSDPATWAALLAHEVQEPLAALLAALEEPAPDLAAARRWGERCRRAVDALARLSAPRDDEVEADVGALAAEYVDLLRPAFERRGLALRCDGPKEMRVRAAPSVVERVLANLLANARDHARSQVEVELEREGELGGLRVTDDGPGFDPALDATAPYATSRAASGGRGLGLAWVAAACEAAGGAVRLERGEGGGARVRALWPLAGRSDRAARSPAGRRLLLVEDEEVVAAHLARWLAAEGWEVHVVPGLTEARAALERFDPDAVLCDWTLPEGTLAGAGDFLDRIGDRLVVYTGDPFEAAEFAAERGIPWLSKPADPAALLSVLGRTARGR